MATDKTKSNFPLTVAEDGWSTEEEATATCFCGAVQLAFPTQGLGLINTFVCNCADCRKVTASMFASNFTVDDKYLKHLRGQENLSSWGQAKTVSSGNKMTNFFCSTCGTLMYRVSSGYPGTSILRIGTVDDFNLAENKLKPRTECFIERRVGWLPGVEGARHVEGFDP
ncbi:histidine acid phosphatase [Diaporthe eres]|uniref:CENP-V/GFA domain-containing protein n=1 Tax=Diaporthe vaccinii TaxID=105482 RepID=A0ABR4EVT9_9PEZI|nr:histidine acid phosphatase [Diaporthe eres]